MTTTVTMTGGRLTVPAQLRRELGVEDGQTFEVETDDQGALILRPAVVLLREDAWAYTPEHRDLLAKAHADSQAGRVRQLTEADLMALGDDK